MLFIGGTMGIPQKSLVIGACEIACHYPELNDAAGDALQLAEKIRLYGYGTSLKHDGKAILENGKPMGMCSLMGLGRDTR